MKHVGKKSDDINVKWASSFEHIFSGKFRKICSFVCQFLKQVTLIMYLNF